MIDMIIPLTRTTQGYTKIFMLIYNFYSRI